MIDSTPWIYDQKKVDAKHIHLLMIAHFVYAGLAIIGIGFLFLHYTILSSVLDNPDIWKKPESTNMMPGEIFEIFQWIYLVIGAFCLITGIGNLLSGIFLKMRKYRIFSLVVAVINCINIPIGTVLGIFTFVVLVRESVRELYTTQ
jgi:hypothetical protein